MSKRVLVIVAAVLVVAFLAYVAVGSIDGSYHQRAARLAGDDFTASREANDLATKVRAVPGVASAKLSFTPGLFSERKSLIAVALRADVAASSVLRVVTLARSAYEHGKGERAAAVLTLSAPHLPPLRLTSFEMSAAQASEDVDAWQSLRGSTGASVSMELADANRRTLSLVGTSGASFNWISKRYALLKTLASNGFIWSDPGECSLGALPEKRMFSLMSRLSKVVPIVPCNSSKAESGVAVAMGGLQPSVVLGFVDGEHGSPVSAHVGQFAAAAKTLLSPGTPDVNVGFFGARDGKLTVLRFFTGTCAGGRVTYPDKTDTVSLALLTAHGVDIVAHATGGQCSPATAAAAAG